MAAVKKRYIYLLWAAAVLSLWSGSSYDKGVEAYRNSLLSEAAEALTAALTEEPGQDRVHLLLGAVYQKMSRFDQAEDILLQGRDLYGINRDNLSFNLANLYYARDRKEDARVLYTELAEGASSFQAAALLNRANCSLGLADYPPAVEDYNLYLSLVPDTPQRDDIERMIALLTRKMADEEERLRLAAQQAALEEARRLEDEKRAAEEAARQQALLDDILASLEDVSDETQVIGAGSEDIVIDDEDSDIEE